MKLRKPTAILLLSLLAWNMVGASAKGIIFCLHKAEGVGHFSNQQYDPAADEHCCHGSDHEDPDRSSPLLEKCEDCLDLSLSGSNALSERRTLRELEASRDVSDRKSFAPNIRPENPFRISAKPHQPTGPAESTPEALRVRELIVLRL